MDHQRPPRPRPKNKKLVRRDTARELFLDYCSNSSVHGVQYFGCRERSCCEKFWWIVVFGMSVVSCAVLIQKTYRRWDQTPVIVSFDEQMTPVWQIPLPAVTICPHTKVVGDSVDIREALTRFLLADDLTDEELDTFLARIQTCEKSVFHYFLSAKDLPNKTTTASYTNLIKNMSFAMDEHVSECFVRDIEVNCTIFSYTMTDDGFCLTFNGLSANELLRTDVLQPTDQYITNLNYAPHWSQEDGYSPEANAYSYPYRALKHGRSSGLSVNLASDDALIEYLCGGPNPGFKVLLHSPADFPQVSNKLVHIALDQDVTIAVKPQIITTSEGLRGYSPEGRQCFFNHERYLQFFRVYTQDNCELECLTNYTLLYCGCVKYSMLRTNRTAVCESNRYQCIMDAESSLLEMDVAVGGSSNENFRAACNCLPACTSMHYDLQISQSNLHWRQYKDTYQYNTDRDYRGIHIARIQVYYKEAQFITSKRSELFGLTDFLANCGGLLGLCMGVSLLSLVELLYFCLVRPMVLWRKQLKQHSSKKDEGPALGLLLVANGRKEH